MIQPELKPEFDRHIKIMNEAIRQSMERSRDSSEHSIQAIQTEAKRWFTIGWHSHELAVTKTAH